MNETPEEKAARKARETAITDAWLDYRMGKIGRHFDSEEAIEKLVRADERAKLAATVPPMMMSVEQEAADRKPLADFLVQELSLSRAWAEVDALRATLATERERYAAMKAAFDANDATEAVILRQRLDAAKKLCDELSLERRALKLRLGDEP